MSYFPLMVQLEQAPVLLVGGGRTAFHKARILVDFRGLCPGGGAGGAAGTGTAAGPGGAASFFRGGPGTVGLDPGGGGYGLPDGERAGQPPLPAETDPGECGG